MESQYLDDIITALKSYQAGDVEEATILGKQIFQLEPENDIVTLLLGNCAVVSGDFETGILHYRKTLEINPSLREAQLGLARIFLKLGRPNDAFQCFQVLLSVDDMDIECLMGSAEALVGMGAEEEAQSTIQLILKLDPSKSFAHLLLARIARGRANVEKSIGHLLDAIAVDPHSVNAYNEMGIDLIRAGDPLAACKAFHTILDQEKRFSDYVFSNWLLASQYLDELSAEEVFDRHQHWQAVHGCQNPRDRFDFQNDVTDDRPLRVGFVSSDLYSHSIFFFLQGLLSAHERHGVEFIFFSDLNEKAEDDRSEILRELSDDWIRIKRKGDDLVSRIIEDAHIDILIDLAGHTGGNRLAMFSSRSAPVQVTWLGYAGTTGLSNMDYRIVDEVSDPTPSADKLATETLIRLPGSFLCYQPLDDWFELPFKQELSPGKIVFGTFNEAPKFSSSAVRLWCEILRRIPEAELVFKCRPFGEEKTREFMMDHFREHGVDESRVRMIGFIPSSSSHLDTYNEMDIALDPFPYNGTTTSCEALWMGVPFITREGDRHCARVGMSLLKSVGLDDWIAQSDEEYVEKAVFFANNREKLLETKLNLREQMRSSPLCDSNAFSGHFCNALRGMWREWCRAKRERI
jgi:predicted O-linked N-acetylglucosamine transferase (SPINDLY family)